MNLNALKKAQLYTRRSMADLEAPWLKTFCRGSFYPVRQGLRWSGHQWVKLSPTRPTVPLPEATWACSAEEARCRANGGQWTLLKSEIHALNLVTVALFTLDGVA